MKKKIFLGLLAVLLLFAGTKLYTFIRLAQIFEAKDPDDLFEPFEFSHVESIKKVVSIKMEEMEVETSLVIEEPTIVEWKSFQFNLPREDQVFRKDTDLSISIYFANGAELKTFSIYDQDIFAALSSDEYPFYSGEGIFKYLSTRFTDLGIETWYDLLIVSYEIQPEKASFWDWNQEILTELSLLKAKEMLMPRLAEYYFGHFETANVKGFQSCKPDLAECEGKALLFLFVGDKEGYEHSFLAKGLTQEEINTLILSIKPSN